MAHRYFAQIINEKTATVQGDEAKHLIKVMRIKINDELILTDKNGYDYLASVTSVEQSEILFDILSKEKNKAEPNCNIKLYMALPKGDKLEFITQKCCELGVNVLQPFVSEFCVAQKSKKDDNKKDRLQKISNEACKQSGRSKPMVVNNTMTFKEFILDLENNDTSILFYEKGGKSLDKIELSNDNSIALIIGSEGGFSENEVMQIQQKGATVASLGNRILRCETAAVSATSIVMHLLGEI